MASSVVTGQLPDNLFALTRAVSLVAVRTARSSTKLKGIRSEDHGSALTLLHSLRVGGAKSPDVNQGIRAVVIIDCQLAVRGEPPRDIASVECELVLDYTVRDAVIFERLTEEDCLAFAQTSGVYNAWPYLREFCQSASARMGLPTQMVLPTLPPAEPRSEEAPPQSGIAPAQGP